MTVGEITGLSDPFSEKMCKTRKSLLLAASEGVPRKEWT